MTDAPDLTATDAPDVPDAPDAPAAPATPKAGRDLRAAVGVGLLLAGLVIGTLIVDARAFLVVVIAAICVGAWELRRAIATKGITIPLVPLLLGVAGMLVSAYARGAEALVVTFGLTIIGILIWRVADGVAGAARDLSASALVTFYPVFLAGFAALMLAAPDGRQRIVVFILVTVFSDIGGYAVGVKFGKHPMAPSLSPKKSWEGFAGSVLSCALVGAISLPLLLDGVWWAGAVLGVEDMSTILPGHGGLMDRLDSLVVVAPVAWALLLLFVPVA